ncbi:TetR/AcrR family transcriptional regulator [Reinekea thalattae]|uniref:TetR/AcrR family transcriptional regulator n=1 Tax=Reinekea thalattae TaxID=2593301 RepID=A0A5C8Z599_9GAMM|nr:TetR/AcrR family transcriptional regulator [Reinekea thalattae]TXR53295.1 TetR/AcrR family transcriptional regulator [Reinekea thalattae]
MSNSAKFDRLQVIEKATQLYWQRGYHATSMRNLQDAINMRPGSIYAAFGSKDGVFKEALEHYAQQSLAGLSRARQQHSSPLAALKQMIHDTVVESRKDAPSCLCMLAKTVAELTEDQAELLSLAKHKLKRIEQGFAELLSEAQQQGEIGSEYDVDQLAQYVQVQIMGLRSYGKANDDAPLERMVEQMFERYLA